MLAHDTKLHGLCKWRAHITEILQKIHPNTDFKIDALEDCKHGHFTTKHAFRQPNPVEYAENLVAQFNATSAETKASVAGRGFVNFQLSHTQLTQELGELLTAQSGYGKPYATGKISVDHTDVNPTGLAHVGHARLATAGDSLYRFLSWCGYQVSREYLLNDCGHQVDMLIESVRARIAEICGQPCTIPADGYHSPYLREVAQKALDGGVSDDKLRGFVLETTTCDVMRDLGQMGVEFDQIVSEQWLQDSGRVERAVGALGDNVYTGTLPKPKSHTGTWNPQPLTLLRMKDGGVGDANGADTVASTDDAAEDVAVRKSNGAWTYFAGDIAFHKLRIDSGADQLINVFGADHHAHGPKLVRAVKLLSGKNPVPLQFLWVQMVSLKRDGKQLRMSKRAGDYVTLADLVDWLGADVVRVAMLSRNLNSPLEIDIDLLQTMSSDNPYYYMQYAYARTCSVQRMASADLDDDYCDADLSLLTEGAELNHIATLLRWPVQAERIAANVSNIQHLVSYARAVSESFHAWWCDGSTHQSRRFVVADNPRLTRARLALVRATQVVLEVVMSLIGIKPLRELSRVGEDS